MTPARFGKSFSGSVCVALFTAFAACPPTAAGGPRRSAPTGPGQVSLASNPTQELPLEPPGDHDMDARALAGLDSALADSISAGEVPGGVLVVARDGAVVFQRAFGDRATTPSRESATTDTIFDLASLTKPVATASAIMRLAETGRLRLADPVWKHIPAWAASADGAKDRPTTAGPAPDALKPGDRRRVTLQHLLTHTAGLHPGPNFGPMHPDGAARQAIIDKIAGLPLRHAPGTFFEYSDLGYILLGEVVERVSGESLDVYARRELFAPLGMADTGFNPDAARTRRTAPTEWQPDTATTATRATPRAMLRGVVHDANARAQAGVSGHAGLFSTAGDLSRFCQMMLDEGEYDGRRVLSRATVRAMTRDQARLDGPAAARRGYGWDIQSPFDGQRGDLFETGYGHTGWTGTSIWIVPEEGLFVLLLTNRVHPDGKGDAGPLRAKVANIVAASILPDPPADSDGDEAPAPAMKRVVHRSGRSGDVSMPMSHRPRQTPPTGDRSS